MYAVFLRRLCVRFHRLLMNNFTMSVVAPASSPNILIPEKFENKPNSFNNVPFAGKSLKMCHKYY